VNSSINLKKGTKEDPPIAIPIKERKTPIIV
jgi:hypothetical protein